MPNDPASEGADTLLLENIQTLRTIDATRTALEERLHPAGDVVLDCSRIEEADLSFVQVLVAARKTADRLGARVRLADPSPVLRELLDRCGAMGAAVKDPFWNGEAS